MVDDVNSYKVWYHERVKFKIELDFGNSYMNVIHFGTGSETMTMISGVSLTGLEGQGESIAEVYQTLAEQYSICLFERKNILEKAVLMVMTK